VKERTESIGVFSYIQEKLADFKLLVKFRLSLFVVFSAVLAFVVSTKGQFQWFELIVLGFGGFLITGAANILNEVLEKDFDRLMKRTSVRPLPTGRVNVSDAVMLAGFMTLFGVVLLALFNPLTALLGVVAVIVYAFVYTPLKRHSTLAVPVGALAGALPVLIGSVAYSGYITPIAAILFGIQFMWQFPHFWAIGWLGFSDYKAAGFRFIPEQNNQPDPALGIQSMTYAWMTVPLFLLAYYIDFLSIISVLVCVAASLWYGYFGFRLYKFQDNKRAKELMFSSFFYLPVVLIVFVMDNLWRWIA
jgi:protoheme IX farnesyltransferase